VSVTWRGGLLPVAPPLPSEGSQCQGRARFPARLRFNKRVMITAVRRLDPSSTPPLPSLGLADDFWPRSYGGGEVSRRLFLADAALTRQAATVHGLMDLPRLP